MKKAKKKTIPQVKISKEIFGDNALPIQAILNSLIISNRTKKEESKWYAENVQTYLIL